MRKSIIIAVIIFLTIILFFNIFNYMNEKKDFKWYENNGSTIDWIWFNADLNDNTKTLYINSYKSKFLNNDLNGLDLGYIVNLKFETPIPKEDIGAIIKFKIAIKDKDDFDLVAPFITAEHEIIKAENVKIQDKIDIKFPIEKTNKVKNIKIIEVQVSSTKK